jgi:ribonuclease Y
MYGSANFVIYLVLLIVVGAAGFAGGYLLKRYLAETKARAARTQAGQVIADAEAKAKEIIVAAKAEAVRMRDEYEQELSRKRAELEKQESRLQARIENLDRKLDQIDKREKRLNQRQSILDKKQNDLEEMEANRLKELERISGLTPEEAKQMLLQSVEQEARQDIARVIRAVESEAKEEGNRKAREIIALAIQRCAADQVAETTVSTVPLPNDEMKGRIIGRGGRNIRALEVATGVDLVVDDTPEAVLISSFDPVRREVARRVLNKLVTDGRIHPARIEKMVKSTTEEVEADIREEGERAVIEVGLHGLPPDLIKLIGQLKYRTSYGQNCLIHSLETAYLAGMMAAELGADVALAKEGGLLHDIGKAIDHHVDGPHAAIGADVARRCGVSPKIVNCIAAHHSEVEPETLEAVLVSAADAISGARPGARRESLENYIKRIKALETVANSFDGVAQSFAIQAGREIRIIVKPEEIDDLAAIQLSKMIANKVEENLEYPGQIKVTVIRETRAVDYAR